MVWAPDYVTPDELKGDLRITDTVDDAQAARAVTAASRAVDRATHRQFGKLTEAAPFVYTARWHSGRGQWLIPIDDLMTSTGLVITTVDGPITAFKLQPGNAAVKGRPWTRILVEKASAIQPTADEDGVTVTGLFGWSDVPVTVKAATLLQATRFFKRRDAPFGVAGSPQDGSEVRLLAKVDPDVAVMVRDYVRDPVVFG
ncbi:MAG TPA: hypothetical protein VIQ30_18865 [Pseudonocardia sp.]